MSFLIGNYSYAELRQAARFSKSQEKINNYLFVSDWSAHYLAQAFRGCAALTGEETVVSVKSNDDPLLEVISDSSTHRNYAAAYIFLCTEKMCDRFWAFDEKNGFADNMLCYVKALISSLSPFCDKIIVATVPEQSEGIFGLADGIMPDSFLFQVRKINRLLVEMAMLEASVEVFDFAQLCSQEGYSFCFQPSSYYTAKCGYQFEFLAKCAVSLWNMTAALKGIMIKCVVLDMDNTLYGGTVSEDGLENLIIGGIGAGEVFSRFQKWLLRLKSRGIMLAICSKNDDQLARSVFSQKKEMILKMNDFASFYANWESKPTNIRKIAEELNISTDAILFLDDQPFEREAVREMVPGVVVPELSQFPECWLHMLSLFAPLTGGPVSHEDQTRTEMILQEKHRTEQQSQYSDYQEYLCSLQMRVRIEPLNLDNIERVCQLSQRSNRFNLRTVRFEKNEILPRISDIDSPIWSFSLRDRIGSYGLICVVALQRTTPDTFFLENMFMSCRALNRGVEDFVFNKVIERLDALGCSFLEGEYIPSSKNQMVYNLLERYGFDKVGSIYRLCIKNYRPINTELQEEEP